jgi:hypothetical protein
MDTEISEEGIDFCHDESRGRDLGEKRGRKYLGNALSMSHIEII